MTVTLFGTLRFMVELLKLFVGDYFACWRQKIEDAENKYVDVKLRQSFHMQCWDIFHQTMILRAGVAVQI